MDNEEQAKPIIVEYVHMYYQEEFSSVFWAILGLQVGAGGVPKGDEVC